MSLYDVTRMYIYPGILELCLFACWLGRAFSRMLAACELVYLFVSDVRIKIC